MIREAIQKVITGNSLTEAEMIETMDEIMAGETTDAQIACFLTALRLKGETVAEITGGCACDARESNPSPDKTAVSR